MQDLYTFDIGDITFTVYPSDHGQGACESCDRLAVVVASGDVDEGTVRLCVEHAIESTHTISRALGHQEGHAHHMEMQLQGAAEIAQARDALRPIPPARMPRASDDDTRGYL